MDNKQNRQFYWEVKDFMSSKKPINENVKKPSRVVDSVKTILEQNKPYKQRVNGTDSNMVNGIRQALDQIQNNEKRFKPECKAFTKNMDTNPFRSLNEGWWDDLVSGLTAKTKDFMAPAPAMTPEQSQERARQNRIRSAMALTSDQLDLEQGAGGAKFTSADLEKEIDKQVTTPGVPLTKEQMRMREISGQLKREEELDKYAEEEAERRETGAPTPMTTASGAMYSPKPSWAQDSTPATADETQAAAAEPATEAPAPVAEPEQTSGDQTFVGKDITFQTPEQIAAMNDPSKGGQSGIFGDKSNKPTPPTSANDAEKKKYAEARKQYWTKRNLQRRQEAEEKLARMGEIDVSKQSLTGRQTIAVNKLRAQRELEGSGDWSEEKIAGMAEREAEIKFRTPEQKAAKEAENRSVVADLARKADEVRRKEAESKVATQSGTKTQSASQTAPKSYRI